MLLHIHINGITIEVFALEAALTIKNYEIFGYRRGACLLRPHAAMSLGLINRCFSANRILVSGFNVFLNKIEDVVAMHKAVLEAAVLGCRIKNVAKR